MFRWWIVVPVVVAVLAGGGYTALQMHWMSSVVTHHEDAEIVSIDERGTTHGDALTIEFGADAAYLRGKCGAWMAPMRLDLWKGQISFGAFAERTWKTPREASGPVEQLTLQLRSELETARAALTAGDRHAARSAQMEADMLRLLRRQFIRSEGHCTPRAQRVTERTLGALSTVTGWHVRDDEAEVIWLDGDHMLKLLN